MNEQKETEGIVKESKKWERMTELELSEVTTEKFSGVLLLSMSTFQKSLTLNKNTYQIPDETSNDEASNIEGYGQLEPVPKLLKTVPLELIVIMASEEAMKEKNVQMDGASYDASPVSLFEHNIANDYKKAGYEIRFKVIESGSLDALQEMLSLVRTLKKNEPNMELYVDIHGGLREDQLLLDAMVYLLREDKIEPKKTYTIHMGESSEIVEVNEMMKAFDLTAGINEFLNYGRSGSLERFFSGQNELVNTIRAISSAISLCRMKDFKKQLKKLKIIIEKTRGQSEDYLQLFYETIKNDYNQFDLLEENGSLSDLIRWCVAKEFYQQALTIIESQVPGELRKKNVWDFNKDESVTLQYKGHIYETAINEALHYAKVFSGTSWKEFDNFVFEKLGRGNKKLSRDELEGLIKSYKEAGEELEVLIRCQNSKQHGVKNPWKCKWEIKFSDSDPIYDSDSMKSEKEDFKRKIYQRGSKGETHLNGECKLWYNGKNNNLIELFLNLHFTLKEMRNKVNHASKEKISSLETVKTAMLIYADCMDEMIKDCAENKGE